MGHFGSCIATKAQTLGRKWCLKLFDIHKTRTTPYHPRSNGFIEQSFRTLGQCLKAACRETRQEWDELVPLILMSYRATPQASTGVTPNMMMLGPSHVRDAPGAGRGGANRERVGGNAPGRITSGVLHAREGFQ